MRYIAFLLEPLYCTRSLLSAIIKDKRLITNNLCFFPLLMDNYDKKTKLLTLYKAFKGYICKIFPSSIYAKGFAKSYGSAKSVKREIDY